MRKTLLWVLILLLTSTLQADPLKDEIDRWKKFLVENKDDSENWKQLKEIAEPVLLKADQNINAGRRYYALHLLAAVQHFLAAEVYVSSQPKEATSQIPALEAEWKKTGATLQNAITNKEIPSYEGVPAAFRAAGESAFSQIRPLYEASMEYAKATGAYEGYFYIGEALAELEFARFCSTIRDPKSAKALKIPGIEHEMNGFEDLLLASYKPPASMDQHPVFIRTSAELKQSRELYAAGFNYGALYKMTSARIRLSKILKPGKSFTSEEANARAAELLKRLDQDSTDHSIARIFIEMAVAEAADPNPENKGGETARAVFEDALPYYFSALKTPPKEAPLPAATVTVTLVRWPYT